MKKLIVFISLLCIFSVGYSQNRENITNESDQTQTGPKMKQAQLTVDYTKDMHSIVKEDRSTSNGLQSQKLKIIPYRGDSITKSQSGVTLSPKQRQDLTEYQSRNLRKGSGEYKSHRKSQNKLQRVEGYAPREEFNKISGHSQYSQDLLIQALGNSMSIKAKPVSKEIKK
jgi:hypothetical protein